MYDHSLAQATYAVTVSNQLAQLEESGNYNTAAIQSSLRQLGNGLKYELRSCTYSIVASQKILAEIYQQGFDSLNNTLNYGFYYMSEGLSDINKSILAMNEAICNKLDEIHDIVNNPRLTAARELYRRASTNFEKGYYEEALEDCLQAVEKEKTDYISWYLLGNIYLYGAGKFSNVINLDKAEEAFINASKYIDADLKVNSEANELGSQIYFCLAQTRYFLSNDFFVEGNEDSADKKLEQAEQSNRTAVRLGPSNNEIQYAQAKYLHLLNKDDESLRILDKIIDNDKTIAVKAVNDECFKTIWPKIEDLIEIKRKNLIEKFKTKVAELVDKIKNKIDSLEKNQEEYDYLISKCDAVYGNDEVSTFYKEYVSVCINCEKNKQHEWTKEFREEVQLIIDNTQKKLTTVDNENYFGLLNLHNKFLVKNENKYKEQVKDTFYLSQKKWKKIFDEDSKLISQDRDFIKKLEEFTELYEENRRQAEQPGYIHYSLYRKPYTIEMTSTSPWVSFYEFEDIDPRIYGTLKAMVEANYNRNTGCWALSEFVNKLNSITADYNNMKLLPRYISYISCTEIDFDYSDYMHDKYPVYIAFQKTVDRLYEIDAKPIKRVNCVNDGFFNNGCYIATCVYGSYDCPEVWTLRRFRDNILASTWYGRTFIKIYYSTSPTLVKWFGKTRWFNNLFKPFLDNMVTSLKEKGFSDTPYSDKNWKF